jgi:septal ring factor EnvC (AmiA/AmiB activator)
VKRALLVVALCGTSWAGRAPEALFGDYAAAEAEVRDLERRAHALDEQAAERRERLKRRLRTLYKLSNGGTLRLLSGVDGAADLAVRHDALARVIQRDLDELQAVREEARQVDAEQARRQEALARALALEKQIASMDAPTGLAARIGMLVRPVGGQLVRGFGPYRERGVELSRRGIELATLPGQPVRAIAAGRVVWVGDAPGLGRAVAIDHGDGWLTLTARLRAPLVTVGELVIEGGTLGHAAGSTIYLELAQDGTPIDPAPWLAR